MVTAARPAQMATIATPAQGDPDLKLLLPQGDVVDPEVSIVIPALNEEKTVGEFVDWCKEGLARAGVTGEVLIVDSSTDRTTEIALEHGARVLRGPKRGLGRAYIDALPYIRGRYILMGDADCTYDFRDLASFVGRFRQGYEFVMGSRWKGSIEPGSMPPLHQYLGTPVTTWVLNVLYSSSFSDIHCGMRGISREALHRMGLQLQSWEYASEMVLKSVHMRLRTAEVPVSFLKDREGRLSHHKRAGWFSPFHAAWINLRAMFVYGAEFFVFKPGLAMLALGISGLILWWPGRKRWRAAFLVKRGARGLRLYRDLHNAIGIWTFVVLMTVSFSGVYLVFPQTVGAGIKRLLPSRGSHGPTNLEIKIQNNTFRI